MSALVSRPSGHWLRLHDESKVSPLVNMRKVSMWSMHSACKTNKDYRCIIPWEEIRCSRDVTRKICSTQSLQIVLFVVLNHDHLTRI